MNKYSNFHDYVIKDGKFIGEFESMYRDFEDPWEQNTKERWASDKIITLNWCERFKEEYKKNRVVEIGCGFGLLTDKLRSVGWESLGIDVSTTAIQKAKKKYPLSRFVVGDILDFHIYEEFKPDIIIMSEVTWYVLDKLSKFIQYLREGLPDIHLIHILTVYPSNEQKYGTEYFTDSEGIMKFFGMKYLEYGEIVRLNPYSKRGYFVGKFKI